MFQNSDLSPKWLCGIAQGAFRNYIVTSTELVRYRRHNSANGWPLFDIIPTVESSAIRSRVIYITFQTRYFLISRMAPSTEM